MRARLHERSLQNPLAAPLLVGLGLLPFAVEAVLSPSIPTVPALFGSCMIVLATANFALGLPRLGASVGLLAVESILAMLAFGAPEVGGLSLASVVLLAVAVALLGWSIRSDEGEQFAELIEEAQTAAEGS